MKYLVYNQQTFVSGSAGEIEGKGELVKTPYHEVAAIQIAEGKRMNILYFSDKDAIEDFIVVNWAWEVDE